MSWVPYILVGLIIILILSCVYGYKHKAELAEIAGIDLPGVQNKPKKKHPARLNTKPKFKPTGKNFEHQEDEKPKFQPKVMKKQANSQPKPSNVETEFPLSKIEDDEMDDGKFGEEELDFEKLLQNEPELKAVLETLGRPVQLKPGEKQISDLTIDTFNLPLVCTSVAPNRILILANGKNDDTILFVINMIKDDAPPLIMHQRFHLSPDNVICSVPIQASDSFGVIYAAGGEFRRAAVTFDPNSKPVVTPADLSVKNAYISSVQKMLALRDGSLFFALTDCALLTVYSLDGHEIFHQNFGRAADMCLSNDGTKLFVAAGQQVVAFEIKPAPVQSVVPLARMEVGEAANCVCWLQATQQVVVGTQSGLIVFHDEVRRGQIVKRITEPKNNSRNAGKSGNSKAKAVKCVAAHPQKQFVAALFGKSGMRLYDVGNGKLYSELGECHRGEASSLLWSSDGKLLFIASKEKPNMEMFLFGGN